jgi:hypothetical protein
VLMHPRRRSSERGQTLVLAVVFLAFFGLFAAAVLGFASVTQSQRAMTEKTASTDSIADGSAQFAMADTGVQGCTAGLTGGTMKFPAGGGTTDTLTYSTSGGACHSSTISAPGQNCGLCVLNYSGLSSPIDIDKGQWTVPGEIDVNGSINVSTIQSGVRIGLFGSGTSCGNTCTPGAVSLASRVLDPLAGALPIPPLGANLGSKSSGTWCPGTYTNLSGVTLAPWGSAACPGSASTPSVFIVTGTMSDSGNGSVVANGSTIYLTAAATLSFTGNGSVSLDCGGPPVPATCKSTTPTTGPYAGVALFLDPSNNGTISFKGNGDELISGTVEASHASIDFKGNGGSQSFQSGRLIISDMSGNGNGGAGLGFGGTIVTSTGCDYWDDSLSGTLANGGSGPGHVRFETDCNSGRPTSIISFAYGP